MSKKLPPLPWTYEVNILAGKSESSGFVYLVDAEGRKIANLWGKRDEKIALAEFICDASRNAPKTDAS